MKPIYVAAAVALFIVILISAFVYTNTGYKKTTTTAYSTSVFTTVNSSTPPPLNNISGFTFSSTYLPDTYYGTPQETTFTYVNPANKSQAFTIYIIPATNATSALSTYMELQNASYTYIGANQVQTPAGPESFMYVLPAHNSTFNGMYLLQNTTVIGVTYFVSGTNENTTSVESFMSGVVEAVSAKV